MTYKAEVYKIFIASPDDVQKERQIIREIIHDWNCLHSEKNGVVLLPVSWETHASPQLETHAQIAINEQVLKDCDLLVGVFWTRFGTHMNGKSGTVVEIFEQLGAQKPVMLYFSDAHVNPSTIRENQYRRVQQFKKEMMGKGLVLTYKSIDDFRHQFTRHLQIEFRKKGIPSPSPDSEPAAIKIVSFKPSKNSGIDLIQWFEETGKIEREPFHVFENFFTADHEVRDRLRNIVDNLQARLDDLDTPYPIMLAGPLGAGKSEFISEFAKLISKKNQNCKRTAIILDDLSQVGDLRVAMQHHFTEIVNTPDLAMAVMDGINECGNQEHIYHSFLRTFQSSNVDLGNGFKKRLSGFLWFFIVSNRDELRSLKSQSASKLDDYIKQTGQLIELPDLEKGVNLVYRVVCEMLRVNPSLKRVHASVLYYFAVNSWSGLLALNSAIYEVVNNMGNYDILRQNAIANRLDYPRFIAQHHEVLDKLGQRIIYFV